jgi:Cof subfamily protein (haloacid dehalogenase superfamily)
LKKKIKLIAADMDGTLLDPAGKITERTAQMIKRAQETGILFVPCTGRFAENALLVMDKYGLSCPVIALNGTLIRTEEEVLYHQFMDEALAKKVLDTLECLGAVYYLFCENYVAIRRKGARHHSQTEFGEQVFKDRYGLAFVDGDQSGLQAPLDKVYKFYVYEDEKSCSLAEALEAVESLGGLEITKSSATNFEVMGDDTTKATGLQELSGLFNISQEEIMAIGDYDNDISMLEYAGLGVAMGNAEPEVKKAADVITLDNQNDGVAHAIEKYCLS